MYRRAQYDPSAQLSIHTAISPGITTIGMTSAQVSDEPQPKGQLE